MNGIKTLLILSLAAASTACVTTKRFESTVADVSTRIDGVQGRVEEHGRKIATLDQRTGALAGDVQRVDGAAAAAQRTGDSAMAQAAEAERLARGKVIWQVTLNNRDMHFPFDSAELGPDGKAALDPLVAKIKGFDRMVFIELQGHTDATGSEEYNKTLGLKRAEAVRSYLHEQGIPLNLMQVISYGPDKPIADNRTADGRAANRRVEMLVLE